MRELEILRDALARAVQGSMGSSPYGNRSTESQARSAGLEALIARLPVDIEELAPLQDMTVGSPTESAFFGMFDFSVFGSDDIFA